MPKNMILRLGVDASDFHKKMAQAGASSESAGKRIKKNLTMSDIGGDVSKIMGWSGSATGLGSVNAGNADLALSQLEKLRSYRDMLAGAGFDDYQFGAVSERIKVLEYELNEYSMELSRTADAERQAAAEADNLGNESRKVEIPVSKASRSLREVGNSGQRLSIVPGFLRRIRDSAHSSNGSLERMIRTIRNVSVVSFGLQIVRGLFGELGSIVRNYISQNKALQAQVNGLSASMGQAFAPSIGIVTNALSYLLPYAVGVSNAFSSLMGALFGTGWSAAADGANKTAAATGGAAKAQKEMNKQLLSFDQINRMEGQKDSGGGGGSGAAAVAPIEPKTPAWMERFKASFSDLFNSSEFQGANIGGKIGMALQTGIDWIGAEGMNFDWRSAATKLRESFDSFIGSGWGESLFHTLGVYLGGFSDFALGLLGLQWAELKEAYRNEGWQGAVVYILGMTAGLVGNGISGLFSKVLAPAFTGISDFFREHGNSSIAEFFEGCAQKMTQIGEDIKQYIVDPIVNGIKNMLGIHSPSTVFSEIGGNCMDGLSVGFSNGAVGVLQKLTDLKDRVLNVASTLREAFSFQWNLPHLRLPHLSVQWDPVDNVLANFFGVNAFPRLNVDWYAKGFITNGTSIFNGIGIGERGREALLPLDSNDGWKDEIAQRIAMILQGSNGGDVNAIINLVLDGDVLTTYVIKNIRRRSRAGTASM